MAKYRGMTYRAATRYETWEVEAESLDDAKNKIVGGAALLVSEEVCYDQVNVGLDHVEEVDDDEAI